jgi:aryl-alcohol dehydrogenase-like predicted oxidoreductase
MPLPRLKILASTKIRSTANALLKPYAPAAQALCHGSIVSCFESFSLQRPVSWHARKREMVHGKIAPPETPGPHGLSRAAFLRGSAALCAAALSGKQAWSKSETMQKRPIPSTGTLLPVIGCGTWRTFDVSTSDAERAPLAQVLAILFEAGGSVIDSSPMYGAAEAVAGDLLAASGSRDRAFLATKVWTSGRAEGVAQMEQSLARFRTDHIELFQVHNLLDWRTQLATLRAWKAEGRISYLGVTHYTPSAYDELEAVMRKEPLDFVQLNYAMNDRAAEKTLLPLAADKGVAVLANQPFGGGGLLRYLIGRPLPDWAPEIGCQSWAQILLKFVLSHPAVTCAIPGTGRPEHMRDNIQAGFGTVPDSGQRERMAALLS